MKLNKLIEHPAGGRQQLETVPTNSKDDLRRLDPQLAEASFATRSRDFNSRFWYPINYSTFISLLLCLSKKRKINS